MGWRQAKGCEVKQICGRLCRNHKGTRRPPPPILMQHDSSKSISSGEVSTELQSSQKWQKLLLLEELGLNLSAELNRPTSERYTASSSSGSCEADGTHEAEIAHWPKKLDEVCLDISIFLGEGTYIYLFVLLHGCFLGSVHKKIDLRHTADLTFLNLGLSRTNKNKTNTASCSGWT